jgi:eukaryotic-like serine/threonine-protein kinase
VSATPAKTICRRCRLEYPGDALFCPNCGTARVQEDADDPMIGATVGERYMLLERMGQGGSGTIYRAEHITLRRKVAVKVLHHELSRDDLAIERFRREATTVGQLDNDHIVEIFDFGRTGDGRLYLAMELLEGDTLADVIEREGQLDIDRVVDVLTQLGETLMEAHAMGYIHRDLRPRNVFLATRRGKGSKPFVKLLDFGLAKLVEKEGEAASTSLGMTFGDPHYMSPEQARGDALDRRADIYSLGCIAYEMLIGEPPFVGGKVFDVLTRHVEQTPVAPQERRSEVPAWLDHAVMRMLAKLPDERFITVYRVIEALRQGSDSGLIMSDEVARRPESVPPTSVSQAMAKLGARAPADLAVDAPPREPPPATATAGVVASEVEGEAEAEPLPEQAAPADPRVGTATALGLGVAPSGTAGGKRAQLSSAARPAQSVASGGSGGLSAAWYADGDAMNREAARGGRRARTGSPSDTGLLIQDEEYAETRRRPWRLPAIAGLAMLLGAAGALAFSAARDDDEESSAETEPAESRVAATTAPPVPANVPAPQAASAGEVGAEAAGENPVEASAVSNEEKAASADEVDADKKADDASDKKAASAPAKKAAKRAKPPGRARASESSARSKLSRESGTSRGREDGERRGRFDHIGVEDASGPRAARSTPTERRPAPGGGGEAAKADFYAKLGDRDMANGDFVGAARNFNKSRGLDPNNANAMIGLGEVALSQGSVAAALAHLRRAVKLVPRSARAHTLLGEALLASGRKQQAASSFRRAIKLEPDHSRAQDGLAEAEK